MFVRKSQKHCSHKLAKAVERNVVKYQDIRSEQESIAGKLALHNGVKSHWEN